jgi:hypothetical protein
LRLKNTEYSDLDGGLVFDGDPVALDGGLILDGGLVDDGSLVLGGVLILDGVPISASSFTISQ